MEWPPLKIDWPPGWPTWQERQDALEAIRIRLEAAARDRLAARQVPYDQVVDDDIVDMVRVGCGILDGSDKFLQPEQVQRAEDNLLIWVDRMCEIRERLGAPEIDMIISTKAIVEIDHIWPYC